MTDTPFAKNQPDDLKIRKCQDTLVTGGLAIIAFGVWTVLKGIVETSRMITNLLGDISFEELTQTEAEELRAMINDKTLFYFVVGIIVVFLVTELIIRLFVGLSARAVGLSLNRKKNGEERKGIVWLILGIFLVVMDAAFIIYTLASTGDILSEHSLLYYLTTLIVDVSSLFVTAEVVFTGLKLRELSKKQ